MSEGFWSCWSSSSVIPTRTPCSVLHIMVTVVCDKENEHLYHLYIQSVNMECQRKCFLKKGFPNPFWLYQKSGSEWLAVVLAARVPKDNLLQNILKNPLCWLRLGPGSKGHKCFAWSSRFWTFYLVLCNIHGLCGCGQTKAFFWFCLPFWTQQMIWSEQLYNTLPVGIHNIFKLVPCRRKQYPINVPSVFWKKLSYIIILNNRTLNKMARNLQHIFMYEWVLLISSQWHCLLEHHSEIFVLDLLQQISR